MVSFRLSEEEYEGLKHICMMVGARSLSDIARDAVHRLLNNGTEPKSDGDEQLRRLYAKMDALDHEVKRLAGLVDHHAGVAADSPNAPLRIAAG
jgi:hypothetical protein